MSKTTQLEQAIKEILAQYIEPHLGCDLLTAKVFQGVKVKRNHAELSFTFGFPVQSIIKQIEAKLLTLLQTAWPDMSFSFQFNTKIVAHSIQQSLQSIPNVKNIIAVASGKGGVGKSTVALNLALSLAHDGANVGMLDADIYGPSQPAMLGLSDKKPDSPDGKKLIPLKRFGLQSMSIGYLVDMNAPMIWRGPMVSSALQQLLNDTLWQDLDYLIIDLPPGTGDIQLTMSQKIPVSGALIVTTPEDIALMDVRRAIGMFSKVSIPVLGVVENMSIHRCSACGHEESIFGQGGAKKLCAQYDIPCFGELPLAAPICRQSNLGEPYVFAHPDSPISETFYQMARKMAAHLSLQSRHYAGIFPKIVVESKHE